MGDPLSATASIISILQLTASVTAYLRDVRSASKDCKSLLLEISAARGILTTLSETINDVKDSGNWTVTIKTISEPDGPLSILHTLLQDLDTKLKRVASTTKVKKVTQSLIWPFTNKETEQAIRVVERQKTLLALALQNDHILLSQEVKADTATIRHDVQQIQRGVNDIARGVTTLELEKQGNALIFEFLASLHVLPNVPMITNLKILFELHIWGVLFSTQCCAMLEIACLHLIMFHSPFSLLFLHLVSDRGCQIWCFIH